MTDKLNMECPHCAASIDCPDAGEDDEVTCPECGKTSVLVVMEWNLEPCDD